MASPEVGGIERVQENVSQSSPSRSRAAKKHRMTYVKSGSEEYGEESLGSTISGNKKLRLGLRLMIGFLLFLAVLGCVAGSKLTLVSLANKLRHVTVNQTKQELKDKSEEISRLYWQLVFILVLPNCLTFVRSAIVGVIGKTRKAYPWPRRTALIAGAISSVVEVVAMSVFVFSVLCYFTPLLALLSMQPVFVAQFVLDIYYTPSRCRQRQNYQDLDRADKQLLLVSGEYNGEIIPEVGVQKFNQRSRHVFGVILHNKISKIVAFFLQVVGTGAIIATVLLYQKPHLDQRVPVIALPLSLVTLGILWSNKFQEFLLAPGGVQPEPVCESDCAAAAASARYKANFLGSLYRIILYPVVAYGVFRLIHSRDDIDPWAGSTLHLLGTGSDLTLFITHVVTSFLGYVFAWTACLMTLRIIGFALPLLLSTPAAILTVLLVPYFDEFSSEHFSKLNSLNYGVIGLWGVIYLGQVLGIGYYLCTKNNLILSQDRDMFLNPHYESVFLEHYLSLNRQVDKYSEDLQLQVTSDGHLSAPPRAIFICSTMYRENVREMRQMLKSIKRMSQWCVDQKKFNGNRKDDLVESHIFFDGAVNGGQLTQYAIQLLSLVNECLGVEIRDGARNETYYGQSMSWRVGERRMKFTVHFKDNLKVKNKKRWSQVMYMNYIIKHRIPESQRSDKSQKLRRPLDKDHTYILTTDADIDFTAESAMVLLDSLASDKEVGAVCARTHPKGAGVLYWYQIFDYAIGHWFTKPAEHLIGSVLCCPGCFSVFRCRALEGVLKEYSSEVKGAADFLYKDMGEDRWLCTLLIQRGWRLDYCAISENHTYCPESFDEFYRQRRRWIPSTIANLLLLISKVFDITRTNNSVSLAFVLFQALMTFSTAISPATVILIIASGLQGAYRISEDSVLATIIILILISVFYGLVCLYTSQKTQIDVAKFLTFLFAILMAVVFVGIFKEIILEIFPVDNGLVPLHPPICPNKTADCLRAQNNLGVALNLSTRFKNVQLPTSPTTWYVGIFAVAYTSAALLHLWEFPFLLHCIWYMLGLPSGYLLLLIYSAVNLDSQSWGTREAAKPGGEGGGFKMMKKWVREGGKVVREFLQLCCGRRGQESGGNEEKVPLLQEDTESEKSAQEESGEEDADGVEHREMTSEARKWLQHHECHEYIENFKQHGYWNLSYIASMRRKEFKAIGISKQGFVLRLEKAAKKLPALVIETDVPPTVKDWLKTLEMEEYTEVFHRAGYKTEEDIENLKEIDDKELRRMGIVKMAHVQRLKRALESLFHPTAVDIQIHEAKRDLSTNNPAPIDSDDREAQFWQTILSNELKPVTVRLQQASKEIGQKLKTLRNSTLALMFLINVMWIMLLYTVELPQLAKYGLPQRAFHLLFLTVYGFIVVISFAAMLFHRFLMLIHFLGRPEVFDEAVHTLHEQQTATTTSKL